MQGGGLTWSKMFSKEMVAQLDYVFSDALFSPDRDDHLLELWTQATAITNAEGFIARHVGFNLKGMEMESIDALASATFLPEYATHGCGILGTEGTGQSSGEQQANSQVAGRLAAKSALCLRN